MASAIDDGVRASTRAAAGLGDDAARAARLGGKADDVSDEIAKVMRRRAARETVKDTVKVAAVGTGVYLVATHGVGGAAQRVGNVAGDAVKGVGEGALGQVVGGTIGTVASTAGGKIASSAGNGLLRAVGIDPEWYAENKKYVFGGIVITGLFMAYTYYSATRVETG